MSETIWYTIEGEAVVTMMKLRYLDKQGTTLHLPIVALGENCSWTSRTSLLTKALISLSIAFSSSTLTRCHKRSNLSITRTNLPVEAISIAFSSGTLAHCHKRINLSITHTHLTFEAISIDFSSSTLTHCHKRINLSITHTHLTFEAIS
jgi:hypothetical protein